MSPQTKVSLDDLVAALEWVSAASYSENSAYVALDTGAVHWLGSDLTMEDGSEIPDDLENSDRYIAIPHRNDFNLGNSLVFRFVKETLPESYGLVRDFFRQRGAYTKFKNHLDRHDLLDAWHEYEQRAIEQALREWAEENGIQIK